MEPGDHHDGPIRKVLCFIRSGGLIEAGHKMPAVPYEFRMKQVKALKDFLLQYIEVPESICTMNIHNVSELLNEKNDSSSLLNLLVCPIKLFQVTIFYSRTADK
jgi:hypothetical protein